MNAIKTVLIIFSKRKVTLPPLSLMVDGQEILPSSSAKLLGVKIDQHLRWTDHVEERELAFKRTLYSIRRYLGKTWGLSQYRMKTFYAAAVEPVLLYACSVWGSFLRTKRGRKKLRTIERGYNVMMMRSFHSVDSGSLSILSQTLRLQSERDDHQKIPVGRFLLLLPKIYRDNTGGAGRP